jgi:hypothetical protein
MLCDCWEGMNPQKVANMAWALAKLGMPPTGSLHKVLWAAAEREAPSMNPQQVANSLFAMSLRHLHGTGSSSPVTRRLFERAAQLNENFSFADKQRVRPALYPVCLFDTSACGMQTIALVT